MIGYILIVDQGLPHAYQAEKRLLILLREGLANVLGVTVKEFREFLHHRTAQLLGVD